MTGESIGNLHTQASASKLKQKLSLVNHRFLKADAFDKAFAGLYSEITGLLNTDQIRIYKHHIFNPEIITEASGSGGRKRIAHLLSPASIAGFTALTQTTYMINDIRNDSELSKINPHLKYNNAYDKITGLPTRSLLSVPLMHASVVLGVFQAVSREPGRFTPQDMKVASLLSRMFARRIHSDLNIPKGPFDLLVKKGRITEKQLEQIEKEAAENQTFATTLLQSRFDISVDEMGASLEKYYKIPFMAYSSEIEPPEDLIKGVSKYYLKSKLWIPVAGDPDNVIVLISDPKDKEKVQEIQRILKAHSYEFRVGLPDDILALINRDRQADKKKDKTEKRNKKPLTAQAMSADDSSDPLVTMESDAGAASVLFVNKMVMEAFNINASDIHVEPGNEGEPATVRMRVDGQCRRTLEVPADEVRPVISRIKIISGLDIAERRKPQDGKAKFKIADREIELRVATVPTVNGESVVLRLLASSGALPLGKLNLTEPNLKEIKRLTTRPHGIFLVVGPTGSGKTTSLHAILGHINTPERKIWTAEDPVEITQPGLQQVQVSHKIGLDFPSVMRAFLRADPDVILIGEMRDYETANIGVESSLTGHLVFSTLHTNSAPETITRLLDLGLDPFNFSDALLGILAQRLVRTLCSDCKEPYRPSVEERDKLIEIYGPDLFPELDLAKEDITVPKAVGCQACGKTGYKGRTGIHELLSATPEIKRLIMQKASVEKIRELAIASGMRTLIQDGIWKIMKGDTDLTQLHAVAAE